MRDLEDAHRGIHRDFADLAHVWKDIRRQWRDQNAIQFEKDYWQPAEQAVDEYLRALSNLTDVLERAERALGNH